MKLFFILPFLVLATPGLAFDDPQTGFGLDLGDKFLIDTDVAQSPDYSVLVGVRMASGIPAPVAGEANLCLAGFTASDANTGMSQTEINAFANTPQWGSLIRTSLAPVMSVETMTGAQVGEVFGTEVVARPKTGPDADNVRLVLTILEIPAGRISVSCVATAVTLDAMLPSFRDIRDGIKPPV